MQQSIDAHGAKASGIATQPHPGLQLGVHGDRRCRRRFQVCASTFSSASGWDGVSRGGGVCKTGDCGVVRLVNSLFTSGRHMHPLKSANASQQTEGQFPRQVRTA